METTNNTASDDRHTVATYLSDMLSLEQHMQKSFESQVGSPDHNASAAIGIIQRIATLNTAHISALEAQLKAAGGSPEHGIKSAFAQLLGTGAAAVNNVRKTKVSKSLRDDYTALGLAAISYTMLHATAAGLGDASTATLAKSNLEDYTPIIVEISTAIPGVVLEELAADGANVTITAAQLTKEASKEAWSGGNTNN